METPAQRCSRLLTALEALSSQEEACLHAGDIASVAQLFKRAQPLVTDLGGYAADVMDAGLSARLSAWLGRRRETTDRLSVRIHETQARLRELESSRRRVTRVVPAYAPAAYAPRRLSLVG